MKKRRSERSQNRARRKSGFVARNRAALDFASFHADIDSGCKIRSARHLGNFRAALWVRERQ